MSRGKATFETMGNFSSGIKLKEPDDETTVPGPMGERMDKPEATEQKFGEGSFNTPQMGRDKVNPATTRLATSPEATPTPKQEALEPDPHTAADVIPSRLAVGSVVGKVVPHTAPQISKKLVKAGGAAALDTGSAAALDVIKPPINVASERYEKGIRIKDILIKQFKDIDESLA